MTRKKALAELIAKVESREILVAQDEEIGLDWDQRKNLLRAFYGSLDAALALHEAVLPGWLYVISWDIVSVSPPDDDDPRWFNVVQENTPARAWLLAILKALHAQEGEE